MNNKTSNPQIQTMVDEAIKSLSELLTRDVEKTKFEMHEHFARLKLHAGTGTLNVKSTRKPPF